MYYDHMSEVPEPEFRGDSPEAIADEFTTMCHYWEGVLNDPKLPPHKFQHLQMRAIDELDKLDGSYGQEAMFWGRAIHIQTNTEYGGVTCNPVFIDNQYWGRSAGVNIINVPGEAGGTDVCKAYRQINYFRKARDGYEAKAFLFDYERANFRDLAPIVPAIEAHFMSVQPPQPDQIKNRVGRLVLYAESIANYIAAGSLETATEAAQRRILDKKANFAAQLSGILYQDIIVAADRAYALNQSHDRLKFNSVDVSQTIIMANCMAVTSFEAIGLGWPGRVNMPIDEGLCLALDVGQPIDEVQPNQAIYVPLARNNVEYNLQHNPLIVRRA
jgi:hypothetical protein